MDASTFVAHPRRGEVLRLDGALAALWYALARPLEEAELLRLFRAAFPRVRPGRLRRELRGMLEGLLASGLIRRTRTEGARPAQGRGTRRTKSAGAS